MDKSDFFIGTPEQLDTKDKSFFSVTSFPSPLWFFTAVVCVLNFCFGITPAQSL